MNGGNLLFHQASALRKVSKFMAAKTGAVRKEMVVAKSMSCRIDDMP